MKTLTMFLVLCSLTTAACSGGMPDANAETDDSTTAATPQSSPVAEGDAIPRDRTSVVLPLAGDPGAPLGQTGGAGGGGDVPSGHVRRLQ